MISTVVEFEEATAFERWALEGLVPLRAAQPHSGIKDVSTNTVRVMVGTTVVRVYAGSVREVHVDLRPLAFGTAWKVLDLLIELALTQAGIGRSGRMTISAKVDFAGKAAGHCPPLSDESALWQALTSLYAATEDIRHSLIHRLAEVDRSTGDLTGRDKAGQALNPITAAHQEAFCRAVQRATQAVLTGAVSSRERSDLAWNLDQLASFHRQATLGGQEMLPASLGIASTRMRGSAVLVDAPTLLDQLKRNFPDRAAYDASFALPDGRHVLVELEHAPMTEVAVNPSDLPSWAALWDGPPAP